MGLLDNALQALKNQYQETKGNVGLLMSDPKQYMSGLNQDAAEYNRLSSLALQAERNAYRGIPVSPEQLAAKQYIDQQQQDMALAFAAPIAYHGSPAKFDKFDISKLGSGEGNQVFGHGMYFAENPKVAEGYRQRLAGGTDPYTYEWQGARYEQGAKPDPTTHALALSYHQGTKVAKDIAKQGLLDARKGDPYALEMGGEDYYKKMLDTASNVKKKDIKAKQGAFYTVDIPDKAAETFIDWNKPVPDELRNRLSPISMKQFDTGVSGTSGEHLYKDLVFSFKQAGSKNPAQDASNWLNANGVQGIKYLDAGSRTTKAGTNNFVVFDPSIVKILKRD